jgi:hypothetical protein
MATRKLTLKELRERLQRMASIQNDEDYSIEELNDAIVGAAAETMDHILSSGIGDHYLQTLDMTISSPDTNLSTILDFYKIVKVYVKEGEQYRPIERINLQDIYPYRPISTPVNVRILYIPYTSTFKGADGVYLDTVSFDGINGWEEHTLCLAAMKVKAKHEEDASYFRDRKR